MESLYELTGDYLSLMEYADSTDPDDEQVFADTLEAVLGAIDLKADAYATVMTELTARVETIKNEIDRLSTIKRTIENHHARMKDALLMSMQATDRREIKTDLHTFKIVKNGGKVPLIIDGDVPEGMCKIILEPDKDRIRAAIENGDDIPYAHLGERGEHLAIK